MTELEKAVKYFNGVWPRNWREIIVYIDSKGESKYRDGGFHVGDVKTVIIFNEFDELVKKQNEELSEVETTELEKAVKHFKGVWPEGWTNMIVSTINHDSYGYGEYRNYSLSKDSLKDRLSLEYEHMWHWVCNKEQFMEAAKKMNLGDKKNNHWNGTDPFEVGHIVKQGEIVAVDKIEVCVKRDSGLHIYDVGDLEVCENNISYFWRKWIETNDDEYDAYGFGKFILSELESK